MLERKIETKLTEYYMNPEAKILVVNGARQIGKSFIIRETAKSHFLHYVEINLKEDYDGNRFFSSINSTRVFYLQVSALYGDNLGSLEDTIIFLDEIQVYPHLLSLLKPLKQESRYRYIASGSLLGITLKHTFIPMGSIEEAKMFPMDFEEFLWACGTGKDVIDYLHSCFANNTPVNDGIHDLMLRRFKEYLICGGLPDSVKAFVYDQNIFEVRKVQDETLTYYKDDASQYDIEHSLKTRRIYDSLPSYMENKVKRIRFNNIDDSSNSNYGRYEDEFDYLINAGCVLGIKAISNPVFPLNESTGKNLIKLYYNDVGILSNILYHNNIRAILDNDSGVNLGSVYETAAAMELTAHGHTPFYFDSKKVGEVDFLINDYESLSVLPLEIKSGNDQYNYRALPKLTDSSGNYALPKGIVFGNENSMKTDGNIHTYPIYMIMFI